MVLALPKDASMTLHGFPLYQMMFIKRNFIDFIHSKHVSFFVGFRSVSLSVRVLDQIERLTISEISHSWTGGLIRITLWDWLKFWQWIDDGVAWLTVHVFLFLIITFATSRRQWPSHVLYGSDGQSWPETNGHGQMTLTSQWLSHTVDWGCASWDHHNILDWVLMLMMIQEINWWVNNKCTMHDVLYYSAVIQGNGTKR